MPDFFDKAEPQLDTPVEVEKIKVGEEEFTQDQLKEYVNLGKLGKEAETKYNTKLDKVWPEYSRAQNELKQAREELETLKKQPKQELSLDDQEVYRQARENAKKLGIITDETFDAMLDQKFQQRFSEQMQARDLLNGAKSLEGKYNGNDGRPKFNTNEILEHMQETGIRDPERAYKDKYESEIDQWRESQFTKRKTGFSTTTGSTAGTKMPAPVKVTKDNLDQLVAEMLHLD